MIETNTRKRGIHKAEYKSSAEMLDEMDAETGEVIDEKLEDLGEYAESDDRLPLEKEEKRK